MAGFVPKGIAQHCIPFLVPFGPLELAAGPTRLRQALRPPVFLGRWKIDTGMIEAFRNVAAGMERLAPCKTNAEFYLFSMPVFTSCICSPSPHN